MKRKQQAAASVTGALSGVFLLAALTGFPAETGSRVGWAFFAAAAVWGADCLWRTEDRRARRCFGVLGALFALAIALGLRLDAAGATGWSGLALCLSAAACLGPSAGGAALRLCLWLERRKPAAPLDGRRVFWLSWLVLMLCWLPALLSFLPGVYSYDADGQIAQCIHQTWSTHHPLAHTLLLAAFYTLGGALGSHTAGLLLLTILQMLCLSAAMAYALRHLNGIGCPKNVRLTITIFLGLMPVHQILSITFTKDILFAAAMTLYAVQWHGILRDPASLRRPGTAAAFVLVTAACCLLRNNAILVPVLALPIGLYAIGRGGRRRLTALLAAGVLLSGGVNAGLKATLKADDGSIAEALNVPAQQLARVYHLYGFEEPVGYEIVEWIPHAEDYTPERSDYVKLHLQVKPLGKLVGFLKCWIREAVHFPTEYVDAFLYLTRGYWDPNDTAYAQTYLNQGIRSMEAGAFLGRDHALQNVRFTSLLPGLRMMYEKLYLENGYQKVPLLSGIIHPATYVWLLLLALTWALYRRRLAALAAAVAMLAYLVTLVVFGPCALTRYSYYLMIASPVLLGMLSAEAAEKKEKEND